MRIVLLLDEGCSYHEISKQLHVPAYTTCRWKRRFDDEGLFGLGTVHPGQPPTKLTPALRARVLERTRQEPPDGSTHWSLRKMVAVMKVNKNIIAASGKRPTLDLTGSTAAWPPTILSLKRRRRPSSACI
jgi:transposase